MIQANTQSPSLKELPQAYQTLIWTLDKEQENLRKYYANSIGDDIPSVSARKKAEK